MPIVPVRTSQPSTNASSNPTAAQAVEDAIRITCEALAEFPFAAPATDEPNVRRAPLVIYPYTIFYRVDGEPRRIEVARVIHGARITDLGRLPEDE